jgi:Acetyltransferase (GNAT) family
LSVERAWQSRGVGSALLERVLLAARNRQINRLHLLCLAENRRMQQLARKFDAELSFQSGSVLGEMKSSQPTPMSMMRELVADSTDLAMAMLDVPSQLAKRPRCSLITGGRALTDHRSERKRNYAEASTGRLLKLQSTDSKPAAQ